MKRRIMLAAAVAMTLCSNASATETIASVNNVEITDEENETIDNRKNKEKEKPSKNAQVKQLATNHIDYSNVSFSAPWHIMEIQDTVGAQYSIVKGVDTYQPQYNLFNVDKGILTGGAAPVNAMAGDSEYTLENVTPSVDSHGLVNYPDDNGEDVWYSVQFKQAVYGSGPNVKYFMWADENGNKLVETDSAQNSVLTINYTVGADIDKIFVELGGTYDGVGGYYVGSDIKNAIDVMGTMNNVSADFVGNTISIDNNDSYNYSAVMAESDGNISKVNSSFIANTIYADSMRDTYGTLVKSLGNIDEITSEFIGNSITSTGRVAGGLVQVPLTGKVGTIHADFINNSVATQNANVLGAMIHNASGRDYAIGNISDSMFLSNNAHSVSGNLYGNIYNSGVITNGINNTVFIGNSLESDSGEAIGGALYNTGITELTDVTFMHNSATSNSGVAKAGAIYTNSDLTINATENNTVRFSGNEIKNGTVTKNQAIYVDNDLATLKFNVAENGKILLYDDIDGVSGYKTLITGNGQVSLLGNIANSDVVVTSKSGSSPLSMSLVNGEIRNYDMLSISSDSDIKWAIDVNLSEGSADNFTFGSSSGTILIDSINLIGSMPTSSKKIQIINGGNANIILSQDVIDAYTTEIIGQTSIVTDVVKQTTYWDDKYAEHTYQDVTSTELKTGSTNEGKTDSIEYIAKTVQNEIATQSLGDTLRLVNQKEGTRYFNANTEDQVYNLTEDLGSTASGTLSIAGVTSGENRPTLNLGDKQGFVLDNSTNLIINDVNVTTSNSSDGAIINAISEDSVINIGYHVLPTTISSPEGSYGIVNNGEMYLNSWNKNAADYSIFDTGIKGTGTFSPNTSVSFINGASIIQGSILNKGTMQLSETSTIKADTITNTGTLAVWADGILSDVTNNGTIMLSSGTIRKKLEGTGNYGVYEGMTIDIFHDNENPENSGLIQSNSKSIVMRNNTTLNANADDLKALVGYLSGATPSTINVNISGGRITKTIDLNNAGHINILEDTTFGNEMGNATIKALTNVAEGKTLTLEDYTKFHSGATITNNGTLNIAKGGATTSAYSPNINGAGNTNILGSVIMPRSGNLRQGNVYIGENGALTIHSTGMVVNSLVNDGILKLNSNGTMSTSHIKSGVITGSGLYDVAANVTSNDIKISQNIKIESGGILTTLANNIDGDVENNGRLDFNKSGIARNYTVDLNNDITGTGKLWLHHSINNFANIGNDFAIAANSTLRTNADLIHGRNYNPGGGWGGNFVLTGGTLDVNSPVVQTNGNTDIASGATVVSNASIANAVRVFTNATFTQNNEISGTTTVNTGATMYMNGVMSGSATVAANGNLYINADNLKADSASNSGKIDGVTEYGNLNFTGGTIATTLSGAGNVNILGDVTLDETHRVSNRINVADTGIFHVKNSSNLTGSYIYNDGHIYWDGPLSTVIQGPGTTWLDQYMGLSGAAQIDGVLQMNSGTLVGGGTDSTWNIGEVHGSGKLGFDLSLSNSATHFNLNDNSSATFDITGKVNVIGQSGLLAQTADETGMAVGTTGTVQVLFGDSENSKLVKTPTADGSYDFEQHRWKDWTDEARADVYYDDFIGHHHKDGYTRGTIEIATTVNDSDSVKWTITDNFWNPEIVENGDLLALWNKYDSNGEEKFFRFRAPDNVYTSQEEVGTAYVGKMNILGAYSDDGKAVINFDGHNGFVLSSGTNFNIKDVALKGINRYYIDGTGVSSGSITAVPQGDNPNGNTQDDVFTANGAYEISGGIENVDFEGQVYAGSGSGAVNINTISFANSNIAQIKDSTFSGNSFSYTNSDTVYSDPVMSARAFLMSNSSIGQKFVGEDGNEYHVGGLYNVKFSDNVNSNSNLSDTVEPYSPTLALASKSYIANIINSEFVGNKVEDYNKAYGVAISLNNSTIHNISNTLFKDNVIDVKTGGYGSIFLVNGGKIDTIDNSSFIDNIVTSGSADYGSGGAVTINKDASIGSITNSLFRGNSNNYYAALALNGNNAKLNLLENTTFENNHAVQSGGAFGGGSSGAVIDVVRDTKFINNTAEKNGGAILLSNSIKLNSLIGDMNIVATTDETGSQSIINNIQEQSSATPYTKSVTTSDGTKYDVSATSYFKGNNSTSSGGAILLNSATIGEINGILFEGNYSTSSSAGGIMINEAAGRINKITNSAFIGNSAATGASSVNSVASGLISEISNTVFLDNHVSYTGTSADVYYGALGSNGGITKIENVIFEDNSIEATQSNAWGGAMGQGSQKQGTSVLKDSKFINNHVIGNSAKAGGGAIYTTSRLSLIDNVEFRGNTVLNKSKAAAGGAIYNRITPLTDIQNSRFLENSIESKAGSAFGGALYIESEKANSVTGSLFENNRVKSVGEASGGAIALTGGDSGLNTISNTIFRNNSLETSGKDGVLGGAIVLGSGAVIDLIEDSLFEGNHGVATAASLTNAAAGGAIYSANNNSNRLNNIINSTFKNNYVEGMRAVGGAIAIGNKNTTLTIAAQNGGLSEFSGNYVIRNGVRSDEAIYMGHATTSSATPTLNLVAKEGGHILFNDIINGNKGYDVNLTGDETGTISIYNDILNADVISNTAVKIDTANGVAHDYTYKTLTSSEDAKYTIDADFANSTADNFKLNEASSGILYIDNLNVISNNEKRTQVQILKTIDDGIRLGINGDNVHLETDIIETLGDTVYDDVTYSEKAGYSLSTTDTKFDSITQLVDYTHDALKLITSSKNNENRNFIFNTDNEYQVFENLEQSAAGTLTIKGKDQGSVINANGYEMFNLVSGTTLNLENITIKGSDAPITMAADAVVNSIGVNKVSGAISGGTVNINEGSLTVDANTLAEVNKTNLSGTLILQNGRAEDNLAKEFEAKEGAAIQIDIDLTAQKADTLATAANSRGVIVVDSINYINGNEDVTDFTAQVLVNVSGNNNLKLELADDLNTYKIKDISRIEEDEVQAVTNFNHGFYYRKRDGILYGELSLATTQTTDDSIKVTGTEDWETSTEQLGLIGDTLKIVNQSDRTNRTFQSNQATDVYTLTDELGDMGQGKFTISGTVDGEEQSTINLQDYDGFVVGENTVFNVVNTAIKGKTNDIITVESGDSTVNLSGAYIDGNIVGNENFNLSISGTNETTINGKVKNANVTVSQGGLSITSNTFADENTTVNITGGNVAMNDGYIDEYKFNNLNADSQATFSVDINLDKNNPTSDTIVAEGSGLITLERFNFTGSLDNVSQEDDFTVRILHTSNDNLQLTLSETFLSQINKEHDLGTQEILDSTDVIRANTLWTDEYWEHYINYRVMGKLGLATDVTKNDSLHLYGIHLVDGNRQDKLGDTLRLVSQADLSEVRNFNFESADNVYMLGENLGTASTGTISVNGVANGDKLSTIDMQNNVGWGLSKNTQLDINNIEFVNTNYRDGALINVSDSDSVVNLNNVKITETKTENAISNAGTLNMTGGVVELETGIVGTGVMNVEGANVVFGQDNDITQAQVNVNSGSLTMGDQGIINGSLTVGANGVATVGINGVNNAVVNDGNLIFKNDGTLLQNVSGAGTTHIISNVVNNARISQSVDIQAGASLKSNTSGLGNNINNDGDLLLSGTLNHAITGQGTTTVDDTLNLYDGTEIEGTLDLNDGNISTQDNTISDFNINKLIGEGSFGIDISGGQTPSADRFVLTDADSQGKINITDLKILNSDDILEGFKVQIVDSNGNSAVSVALSEEMKSKEWKLGRVSRPEEDTVQRITKYSDIYNTYTRGGNLYGTLVEATTSTPNDSIELVIDPDKTRWDEDRSITGTMGDTLALWNALETDEEKQFVFDRVATYKVADDVTSIGETKGENVSIVGFSNGENKATIDFNGKGGFVLTDATEMTLSDTRLTGAENVIEVKNNQASLIVHDSIINGNVTGDNKFNVNINGENTTTIDGTFKNADTVLNGGNLRFNTDTFSDSSDTLKANAGTIQLNNDEYEDYIINSLESANGARYNIDINMKDKKSDTITVNSGSGLVVLDNLNIVAKAEDVNSEYKVQILKVGSGDLELSLTDEARAQIDNPEYLLGTETISTRDEVKAVTNWLDEYSQSTQDIYTYGRMDIVTTQTTNDSIGIKISDIRNGDVISSSQGDTLKVVNNSSDREEKIFGFDTSDDTYEVSDNLGQTSGKIIVNGVVDDKDQVSTVNMNGYSGFEVPDGASVELNNVNLINGNAEAGSVVHVQGTDADVSLKNVNLINNSASGEHGGAIYSNSDVTITTDNFTSNISGNNTSVDDEAIYLGENAKLTINTVNNGTINISDKIGGADGYKVDITGDDTGNVNLSSQIDNAKVSMSNITLNLSDNNHFANSDLTINSGTLNLVNDRAQEQRIRNLNIGGSFKMNVDADLENLSMDRLPANTIVTNGSANIKVDKINLLSDTKANSVAIPFAYSSYKNNVKYIGAKELSKATQVTTAFAPIYKYGISYENRSDMGYFVFTKGGGASPHSHEAFNPAILSSDVTTQSGMQNAMNQAFLYAFEHGETFMNNPSADRFAKVNSNLYALSTDYDGNRQHIDLSHENNSVWVKPYATFENIELKNGPKVDTIDYGTLVGFDSNIKRLKHGWANVGTVYLGYTGSQIKYSGVDTTMNGGLLGVTETFYKGNLWTAITASSGAGVGETHTMYGKEDTTSLMAGVASKTGYNFEFADGKFIVQPRMMLSYSMVKTFDYKNAAGVRIDSDPVHTIQLNPAIKFIGNVKGWQPYASVGMVWNLMNNTHTTANDVLLPEMHTKPYVEYGVGVQRVWDEKFSAYGQAMVRNGGRTGISLTFGFRWALGKDGKEIVKNTNPKVKNSKKASNTKKVLKSLSSKSTITSDNGNLKSL